MKHKDPWAVEFCMDGTGSREIGSGFCYYSSNTLDEGVVPVIEALESRVDQSLGVAS